MATSSSVRFKALSIADIAAETGSGAGFCFAIVVRLTPSASIAQPSDQAAKRFRRLASADKNAVH